MLTEAAWALDTAGRAFVTPVSPFGPTTYTPFFCPALAGGALVVLVLGGLVYVFISFGPGAETRVAHTREQFLLSTRGGLRPRRDPLATRLRRRQGTAARPHRRQPRPTRARRIPDDPTQALHDTGFPTLQPGPRLAQQADFWQLLGARPRSGRHGWEARPGVHGFRCSGQRWLDGLEELAFLDEEAAWEAWLAACDQAVAQGAAMGILAFGVFVVGCAVTGLVAGSGNG